MLAAGLVLQGAGAEESRFDFRAAPLKGLKAEVATLIVGEGEGGSLPMAVLVLPPLLGAEDEVKVPLIVEVAGAGLFEAGDELGEIEFYVYALNEEGWVAAYLSEGVTIDLQTMGAALYDSGLKFIGHLELAAGSYRLRTLVRLAGSGRFGVRSSELTIDELAAKPRLGSPKFEEAPGHWLTALDAGGHAEAPPGEGGACGDPLTLSKPGFLPAALPLLAAGSLVEMELMALGMEPGVDLTARLVARGGEPSLGLPVRVVERLRCSNGAELVRVGLRLPELASNVYTLTVEGRRQEALESRSPPAAVVVAADLQSAGLGESPVWGELGRWELERATRETTEVELPKLPGRERRKIDPGVRDLYQAVLSSLIVSGSFEAAVAELMKGEVELVTADPELFGGDLAESELRIAAAVGEAESEGLLPVALLHLEAYRRHHGNRSFALARHSRRMVAALAELYASRSADPQAGANAAALLTCIAGDMLESKLWRQSRLLLERAGELDGDNPHVPLLMAITEERFGHYSEAAAFLRRTVNLDPKIQEARLRLAINGLRLGRRAEAERTLSQLIREGGPEWLLVIAYQELAAMLQRTERTEEAEEWLRRAIDRYPRQPRLFIALAWVLESRRQPEAASQVLSRLPLSPEAPSPRYAYSGSRNELLDPMRVAIRRAAEVRLPLLGQALSSAAGR